MFCTKCDSAIEEGSSICGKCGHAVDNPAVETAFSLISLANPKETVLPIFGKKGKMLLLITGIVLVLVILDSAAFFANRNIEQPETESDLFSYTDSPLIIPGEESTLIYNGENKPETIKGCYASSAFSMDKKKWAILVDQIDGSGTLYYYDGSAAKKLSDDVSVFTISADGSGVAYLTNLSHDQIGILQLYDASMDTSRVVSSCAAPYMILSPDGKSIAYNSDLHLGVHGTSLPGSTAYISVNGRPGDPMEPNEVVIGLSNNAEYVYYLKYEAVSFCISIPLYVDSSGTHKLGSVIMNAPIAFNQDLSEILYVDDSGKTYLSKVAGDKEKVTDIFLDHMCVPYNSQMIRLSNETETFNISMYNVKHLTGHSYLYHDSDDLKVGYLDQKLRFSKTNAITSILDRQIQWTADGKGLYYPDDTGRLQYLQDVSDPDAKPMEVESDHFAKSFIVTPDQSTIYFIDKEGTLWMKKGETDAVAAAEKVIDNSLTLASDGQGLYFIADSAHDKKTGIDSGTLSYLSGSPDDKVSKIADKVAYVSVRKAGVAYYVFSKKSQDKNKFQVFYSDDGKNFSSVMDNAFLP